MTTSDSESFTRLVNAAGGGDASARNRLFDLIFDKLRAAASRQMRRDLSNLTEPTDLVGEVYIKLFNREPLRWESRRHFWNAVAKAMRELRVDAARKRNAQKRGRGKQRVPLDEHLLLFEKDPIEMLALNEALDTYEQIRPRGTEVVMLKYFAGLTGDEIAELLEVSPRTVDSDWQFAQAWLHRELSPDGTSDQNREVNHGG